MLRKRPVEEVCPAHSANHCRNEHACTTQPAKCAEPIRISVAIHHAPKNNKSEHTESQTNNQKLGELSHAKADNSGLLSNGDLNQGLLIVQTQPGSKVEARRAAPDRPVGGRFAASACRTSVGGVAP